MDEMVNFTTNESLLNVTEGNCTAPTVNAPTVGPSAADEEKPLDATAISIAVACCLICFITVVANLLVLGAFCTERRLRTYTNYYIVGLSVADLVAGLITMPLYSLYWVLGYWPLGPAICDTFLYLNHIFVHTSIIGPMILAVDRHQAVYHPLQHLGKRTLRHATFMISVSYVVPFLLWLPLSPLWPFIVGERRIRPRLCYPQYVEDSLAFSILAPILLFWIPVLITMVLYWRIYRVIRKSRQRGPVRMMTDLQTTSTSNLDAQNSPSTPDQKPVEDLTDPDIHPIPLSPSAVNHTNELNSGHENPTFEADLDPNNLTPQIIDDTDEGPPSVKTIPPSSSNGNLTPADQAGRTTGFTGTTKPTEREREVSTRESRRAFRTLTPILITLLVSSVPWSVLVIIYSLCPSCIPLVIYQSSVYAAHMNSTVNPFCYAKANPLYLDAIKKMWMRFRRAIGPTRAGRSSSQPCTSAHRKAPSCK